jgi:hypothetical protein
MRKINPLLDGRTVRRFDCDWNNDSICLNACTECRVCKYLDFLDFAGSVGLPEGSTIEYNHLLDDYLKMKTISEKQNWIVEHHLELFGHHHVGVVENEITAHMRPKLFND